MGRDRCGHPSTDATGADVTSWGPVAIARFAKEVGFIGETLHDAVSLAIAASGGADHYRHNPISMPGAERQGLWATRLDQTPEGLVVDLFDPKDSARVARVLWEQSGGSFAWHPTWITNAAAAQREWVTSALTPGGKRAVPVPVVGFGDRLANMVNRANALGQILDRGHVLHD